MGAVRAVRNLRTELNCPPGKEVKVVFYGQANDVNFLSSQQAYLRALARIGSADYRSTGDRPRGAATAVVSGTEIYLPMDDLINLDEERARLIKEVGKAENEFGLVQKKLANREFLAKARPEVIQKERDRANRCEEKIRALRSSLEKIQEIQAERN